MDQPGHNSRKYVLAEVVDLWVLQRGMMLFLAPDPLHSAFQRLRFFPGTGGTFETTTRMDASMKKANTASREVK